MVHGWVVVRFAWEHVMFNREYVDAVLRSAVHLLEKAPERRALDRPDDRLTA